MIDKKSEKNQNGRDASEKWTDFRRKFHIRLVKRAFDTVRDCVVAWMFNLKPPEIVEMMDGESAVVPVSDGGYHETLSEYAKRNGVDLGFRCEFWKAMDDPDKKRPSDTQAKYEGQSFCKDIAIAMGYPPQGKLRLPGEPPAHRQERHFDENLHHDRVLEIWWEGINRRMPDLGRDHPYLD